MDGLAVDKREMKAAADSVDAAVGWLERALPYTMRRLMDTEENDMPILQLPLAQLRLAQALHSEDPQIRQHGETMGRLSELLGVRQNALTQAADRLVNHSLAERLTDESDRRLVRLRLTSRGEEWVEQRRTRRRARLAQVYGTLNPNEKAAFLKAVRTLESAARRLDPTETQSSRNIDDTSPESAETRRADLNIRRSRCRREL